MLGVLGYVMSAYEGIFVRICDRTVLMSRSDGRRGDIYVYVLCIVIQFCKRV